MKKIVKQFSQSIIRLIIAGVAGYIFGYGVENNAWYLSGMCLLIFFELFYAEGRAYNKKENKSGEV